MVRPRSCCWGGTCGEVSHAQDLSRPRFVSVLAVDLWGVMVRGLEAGHFIR